MAIIQSGATADLLTIDPTSLAARVTIYDAASVAVSSFGTKDPTRNTYLTSMTGQANTASSDIIAIEAGATLKTKLRQIIVWNPGSQTAAGLRVLQLIRTTAPGTAGVITPAPADATMAAFSGLVRAKPTALGLAGTVLMNIPIFVPTAVADFTPRIISFDLGNSIVPPVVSTGNGLALRDPGAGGAAGLAASFVFTEE